MLEPILLKIRHVLRAEGAGALVYKALRYVPLRLRLYVWLPLAYKLGIPTPLNLPDRHFLERDIFGWLSSRAGVQRVLFAGVESYTWHYYRLLGAGQELYTIDFVPKQACWGRKGFHQTGSVTELSRYYPAGSFDVVIYNGVIGWGLDAEHDVNQALEEAYQALAPGGMLIIGWDNEPKYTPFVLERLAGYRKFKPLVPNELGLAGHRHEASPWRRHTFDFLAKK